MLDTAIYAITAALLSMFPPMDNEARTLAEETLLAESLIAINEAHLGHNGDQGTSQEALLIELTTEISDIRSNILEIGSSFYRLPDNICGQRIDYFASLSQFGSFAIELKDADRDHVREITAPIIEELVATGGVSLGSSYTLERLIDEARVSIERLIHTRSKLFSYAAEVRRFMGRIALVGCVEPGL